VLVLPRTKCTAHSAMAFEEKVLVHWLLCVAQV
jgi:hypothetical protein